MRISDWSSDVCSSDLQGQGVKPINSTRAPSAPVPECTGLLFAGLGRFHRRGGGRATGQLCFAMGDIAVGAEDDRCAGDGPGADDLVEQQPGQRSEEHTSELQSLMRISYAVFCLKKKRNTKIIKNNDRCKSCETYIK